MTARSRDSEADSPLPPARLPGAAPRLSGVPVLVRTLPPTQAGWVPWVCF